VRDLALGRAVVLAVLVAGGAALPFAVPNPYYLQVLVTAYAFAIAVCGLNVLLGYAGQLSLAHAAFFGIGAYTVALLTTRAGASFWLAIVASCLVSGFCGFAVGLISLRTRGNYFAIFTAAIGVMINTVFSNWQEMTNGNIGIINIPGPSPLGPLRFDSTAAKYEVVFAGLLITVAITAAIRYSLTGRTLLALAQNEDLARAVGIDVMRAKRLAFITSTVLAGFGGGLYAMFVGYLGPEVSGLDVTFNMLLYAIVGGIGTLAGPLVGTLLLVTLTQYLQVFQKYEMLVFGPLLVLLVMYFPGGIMGAVAKLRARTAPA
jgi:branched-chain amino acid transport system permease protein